MRIIGLTGSIASGKSTVTRMLRELGAPVIDADAIVHALQQPGTPVTHAIAQAFGPEVLGPDGSLNRPALGRIVFSDPERRKVLEGIVHPAVRHQIWREVDEYRAEGRPAVILDIPLLFESGWANQVDEVWVVYVDPPTQRVRLIERDGLAPEDADRRIASQLDLQAKVELANRVINNSGALEDTRRQVEAAWSIATSAGGPELAPKETEA